MSGRYRMVERRRNREVELLRRPGGGLCTMPLIGNLLLHVGGTLPHSSTAVKPSSLRSRSAG